MAVEVLNFNSNETVRKQTQNSISNQKFKGVEIAGGQLKLLRIGTSQNEPYFHRYVKEAKGIEFELLKILATQLDMKLSFRDWSNTSIKNHQSNRK